MLPDFTNNWDLAVAVFIMPIAVQWWAVVVSRRGAGRRQLHRAAHAGIEIGKGRARQHAVLQRGALRAAAVAVDPGRAGLADRVSRSSTTSRRAFPHLDPNLIGHDIAFPAMLRFLPVGWMGLMLGGLVAANSSTILTHLNWGASYLVHDFYRRFVNRGAPEKHYVMAGRVRHRICCSCSRRHWCSLLDTAKDSFQRHPAGGRGHRPALPGALVLVAGHGVVRDRGHGQLVRRFGGAAGAGEERLADRYRRGAAHHHRLHHRLLDC